MALSNATNGATGKAHGLTGKHGDKHAASVTGLEFLTGETIATGDATDAQPKQGVSFASLVQTIARTVLPATRKADAAIDIGADTPALETQGNADKPDNPVALLALALHGDTRADQAASAKAKATPKTSDAPAISTEIPVAVTESVTKQPHEGKHLGKRIHELKQRVIVADNAKLSVEPVINAKPVTDVDKAEPIADTAPSDAVVSDKPDQAAPINSIAQQPVAPVAAPIVSEGKSPEHRAVTGKQAPAISGKAAAKTKHEDLTNSVLGIDQPKHELTVDAQQPVVPVAAPIISEGKSPEQRAVTRKPAVAVSGEVAVAAESNREAPVASNSDARQPEDITQPKPEAIRTAQVVDLANTQKKSQIDFINIQKSNDFSDKASDKMVSGSAAVPARVSADVKAVPEVRPARTIAAAELPQSTPSIQTKDTPKVEAANTDAPEIDTNDVQPVRTEPAPVVRADATVRDVQQPQFTAPAQPATITTNLTGALNSQVVDMGVSGQWIDDIARQIASIGTNPGHGSFRIESQALGGVRVDIAPSVHGVGCDVLMRVDNDAAFAALDKDRDRLVQDARMASVRIGELRIDRLAPAQDAQGSGSSTSQQQGNSSGQQGNQQAMNQTNTQTGGQGGQQPGRQDAAAMNSQRDGQNSPKAPFTNAVMNSAERDDVARSTRSDRSDTARYA